MYNTSNHNDNQHIASGLYSFPKQEGAQLCRHSTNSSWIENCVNRWSSHLRHVYLY